jgi:hypothetical protein
MVCNLSTTTRRLNVTMDSSDACVFSGCKKASFVVLPHSYRVWNYNVIPMRIGWMNVPRWHVSVEEPQGWKDVSLESTFAVFVLPRKTEAV